MSKSYFLLRENYFRFLISEVVSSSEVVAAALVAVVSFLVESSGGVSRSVVSGGSSGGGALGNLGSSLIGLGLSESGSILGGFLGSKNSV